MSTPARSKQVRARLPIDLGTPLFTETLRSLIWKVCPEQTDREAVVGEAVERVRKHAGTVMASIRLSPDARDMVIDGTVARWEDEIASRLSGFTALMTAGPKPNDGSVP